MIFLDDARPVARVGHTCQLCGRTIEPGETYRRCRLIGDDGPYTFKECAHCRAFMDLTTVVEAAISWGEGYSTDDFCEWEPEDFQGARWQVQWRRHWRRRDGALYPVPCTSPPASTTDGERQQSAETGALDAVATRLRQRIAEGREDPETSRVGSYFAGYLDGLKSALAEVLWEPSTSPGQV